MESKSLCETSDKRFALLIDADNVSARYIKPILNELSKYGTVTIKRIYGDWTLTLHSKWKDALLENSITPIQQFGYTQGKNATDSAMIIDAMDLLYTDNVDGFCLVSSDSDFTRLASRLRESGRTVIGMGEKKTPVPFRRACDVFTTLELLVQNRRERNGGGNEVPKDAVEQAVVDIITDNQNNGKATGLGEIGSRLQKRYPDFDVRSYGTNLLSKLLEEFSRVRITKDHSSVTVELADGPEDKGDVAEKPAKAERGPKAEKPARTPKAEKAEKVEKADGGEGAEAASGGDAAEKPVRRGRNHRGTRRVSAKAPSLDAGDTPVAALPEPAAAAAVEEAAEAVQAAATAVEDAAEVVAAAPAEDAPAARDMKPGRRARAHRKKAAEAVEGTLVSGGAPEDAPADAAEPAPKRTRKAPAKKRPAKGDGAPKEAAVLEAAASPEATAEPEAPAAAPKRTRKAPAKKRPAKGDAKAPAADTPAGYIHQMVAEAGADGIMLSTITDRLRAKFKDFKVRDLGFAQMRQYMASIGDYDLEKSGRNFRVRLSA